MKNTTLIKDGIEYALLKVEQSNKDLLEGFKFYFQIEMGRSSYAYLTLTATHDEFSGSEYNHKLSFKTYNLLDMDKFTDQAIAEAIDNMMQEILNRISHYAAVSQMDIKFEYDTSLKKWFKKGKQVEKAESIHELLEDNDEQQRNV